ncbi:cytochrome c [Diaphorobacter ruginosibacter]|uniref:c-type cytochrome n=1 Tax=Diaphorobacter ruginosibacter TaxID=1715720 RepID=UPI003341371D
MNVKALAMVTALSAGALLSMPASAQFAKPEDAIKYRQGSLFVLGQHFSRLGGMAQGKIPFDAKAAQENADVVAYMAKLPWAGFGPGTEKGAPNKSKPDIWLEPEKFKEHADKFEAESAKLAAAAKTGTLEALKAAFGPTANTCKSCHDAYRSK